MFRIHKRGLVRFLGFVFFWINAFRLFACVLLTVSIENIFDTHHHQKIWSGIRKRLVNFTKCEYYLKIANNDKWQIEREICSNNNNTNLISIDWNEPKLKFIHKRKKKHTKFTVNWLTCEWVVEWMILFSFQFFFSYSEYWIWRYLAFIGTKQQKKTYKKCYVICKWIA